MIHLDMRLFLGMPKDLDANISFILPTCGDKVDFVLILFRYKEFDENVY